MHGEVRLVADVAKSFAELSAHELARSPQRPFRLGCSGGGSGVACTSALAARDDVDFSALSVYFADERCVAPDSPDLNANALRAAFGPRLAELAAFHPMSCETGPEDYEQLLSEVGPLDLLQLGMGPDGHTASLFPNSPALNASPQRLVVVNHDQSGKNRFERLTLTYGAIAQASLVVFAVIGEDKADALGRLARGEDLPAGRVEARRLIWLVDRRLAGVLDGALS